MKSKQVIILAIFLIPLGVQAQGSLTLNEGETYTFEFNTLRLIGAATPQEPYDTFGSLGGFFSPSLQPDSVIQFEMFEGLISETPIGSQTLNALAGFPAPPGPFMFVEGAWQDLQGAIRISMLSGSATLGGANARVLRSESSGLFEYSSTILPIPEPSSLMLLGVGSLLGLVVRITKGYSAAVQSRKLTFASHSRAFVLLK